MVAIKGNGKLNVTGTNSQLVKKTSRIPLVTLRLMRRVFLMFHSLSNFDLNIQVSNLMGATIGGSIGSAVYVAILSALYKKNLKGGLAVLGNISIGGAVERSLNFADKVTLLSENGAKTVLVPMDNLPEIGTIPSSILGKTDVPFYGNSQILLQKAVLNE